jgi:S-adenosylmethionine decarboxylase
MHSQEATASLATRSETYLIRHIIVEAYGCPSDVIDDLASCEELLRELAVVLHTETMGELSHRFEPQGITAMMIVGASHLSVHSWPEHHFATVDLVVCTDSFLMSEVLAACRLRLQAEQVNYLEFRRGLVS